MCAASVRAAEELGKHTQTDAWADVLLPRLATPGLSVGEQTGILIVLSALVRGAGPAKAAGVLEAVAVSLSSEEVSGVQNDEMVEEVFLLVRDILAACEGAGG